MATRGIIFCSGGGAMKKLFCILLLLSGLGFAQTTVPLVFFGMHDNKTTNWPPLPFGTLRLWDSATQWGKIETSPGVYSFSRLDGFIAEAHANGVTDILWNPSMTPTFYSSNPTDTTCNYGAGWCWAPTDVDSGDTHFKNFITAVINHVGPGVIKYYDGWNEPDNGPMWKDSTAHLKIIQQDLYNTVHALDPGAKVVFPPSFSGGGRGFIQDLLSGGLGPFADINSFHSKKCTPEDDIANTNNIKSLFGTAGFGARELWNTEGGWGNTTNCPGVPHPDTTARLHLINWSQGIARYYWYAYDNTVWGQLGTGQTLNSAGIAYQQVSNWMVGASGGTCSSASNVWTCNFTRTSPSGYQAKAVWYTAGTTSYTVPPGFTKERDLSGNTTTVSGGSVITIGSSPVLLETSGAPAAPSGLTATVH
jgi:hypothetical protein